MRGEVREPGTVPHFGASAPEGRVYLAGGITQDASLDSAQLFRTQATTMKILSVRLKESSRGNPVDNV